MNMFLPLQPHSEAFDEPHLDDVRRVQAFAACEALVRREDPNRYFANLFTPHPHRQALYALYAFNAEMARTRDVISDPMPGEIRLQWWRDALMGEARGDVMANPIAGALIDTIQLYRLPRQPFLALIDARTFDLYNDPMPTLHDLEGYCGETCSILMQLASLVLNEGPSPLTADVAGHAGVAYTLTELLRQFARHVARGQVYIPVDVLTQNGVSVEDVLSQKNCAGLRVVMAHMRHLIRGHVQQVRQLREHITPTVAPDFLHLALIEPYLARLEKSDDTLCSAIVDLPQWRKQWILWRAARKAAQ
jgi:phytoene synthase